MLNRMCTLNYVEIYICVKTYHTITGGTDDNEEEDEDEETKTARLMSMVS